MKGIDRARSRRTRVTNSPEGGNRVASPSSSSPSSRPGGNGGVEYEVEQTNGGGLDRLVVSNRRPSCAATAYIPYLYIPCMRSVHILYSRLYSTGTRARARAFSSDAE